MGIGMGGGFNLKPDLGFFTGFIGVLWVYPINPAKDDGHKFMAYCGNH